PYHEVTSINDVAQTITVYDRTQDHTFDVNYDSLILSPGCSANTLNLDSDIAFTLRNMEDTDAIDNFIEDNKVKKALVIGAGYIGLEIIDKDRKSTRLNSSHV